METIYSLTSSQCDTTTYDLIPRNSSNDSCFFQTLWSSGPTSLTRRPLPPLPLPSSSPPQPSYAVWVFKAVFLPEHVLARPIKGRRITCLCQAALCLSRSSTWAVDSQMSFNAGVICLVFDQPAQRLNPLKANRWFRSSGLVTRKQ